MNKYLIFFALIFEPLLSKNISSVDDMQDYCQYQSYILSRNLYEIDSITNNFDDNCMNQRDYYYQTKGKYLAIIELLHQLE